MPQHLWEGDSTFRLCEVCHALQIPKRGEWWPSVGPICPGDDEDDGQRRGRPRRPKPDAPAAGPRVLEPA